MDKGRREFWARLLLGLYLFVLGAMALIGLTFNGQATVMALFAIVAGLFWLSTLFP